MSGKMQKSFPPEIITVKVQNSRKSSVFQRLGGKGGTANDNTDSDMLEKRRDELKRQIQMEKKKRPRPSSSSDSSSGSDSSDSSDGSSSSSSSPSPSTSRRNPKAMRKVHPKRRSSSGELATPAKKLSQHRHGHSSKVVVSSTASSSAAAKLARKAVKSRKAVHQRSVTPQPLPPRRRSVSGSPPVRSQQQRSSTKLVKHSTKDLKRRGELTRDSYRAESQQLKERAERDRRMREVDRGRSRERIRSRSPQPVASSRSRDVKRKQPSPEKRHASPPARARGRNRDRSSVERDRERREKDRQDREMARNKEREEALARCQERQRERERVAKEQQQRTLLRHKERSPEKTRSSFERDKGHASRDLSHERRRSPSPRSRYEVRRSAGEHRLSTGYEYNRSIPATDNYRSERQPHREREERSQYETEFVVRSGGGGGDERLVDMRQLKRSTSSARDHRSPGAGFEEHHRSETTHHHHHHHEKYRNAPSAAYEYESHRKSDSRSYVEPIERPRIRAAAPDWEPVEKPVSSRILLDRSHDSGGGGSGIEHKSWDSAEMHASGRSHHYPDPGSGAAPAWSERNSMNAAASSATKWESSYSGAGAGPSPGGPGPSMSTSRGSWQQQQQREPKEASNWSSNYAMEPEPHWQESRNVPAQSPGGSGPTTGAGHHQHHQQHPHHKHHVHHHGASGGGGAGGLGGMPHHHHHQQQQQQQQPQHPSPQQQQGYHQQHHSSSTPRMMGVHHQPRRWNEWHAKPRFAGAGGLKKDDYYGPRSSFGHQQQQAGGGPAVGGPPSMITDSQPAGIIGAEEAAQAAGKYPRRSYGEYPGSNTSNSFQSGGPRIAPHSGPKFNVPAADVTHHQQSPQATPPPAASSSTARPRLDITNVATDAITAAPMAPALPVVVGSNKVATDEATTPTEDEKRLPARDIAQQPPLSLDENTRQAAGVGLPLPEEDSLSEISDDADDILEREEAAAAALIKEASSLALENAATGVTAPETPNGTPWDGVTIKKEDVETGKEHMDGMLKKENDGGTDGPPPPTQTTTTTTESEVDESGIAAAKKKPQPPILDDIALDFEEISDGELEEEAAARVKGLGDALGVDWASLVAESKRLVVVDKKVNASIKERWDPKRILLDVGVSVKMAGREYVERLLMQSRDVVKVVKEEPVSQDEDISVVPMEAEAAVKEEKVEGRREVETGAVAINPLHHPVACTQVALRRKLQARGNLIIRQNLLTELHQKALCARRDLQIRRQLCGLPIAEMAAACHRSVATTAAATTAAADEKAM